MEKLWRDGACSYHFSTPRHSFDKSDRFGRYSIYFKDNVNKQKLTLSELDNPELLLKRFKKQLEEASSQRFRRRISSRKKQIQEAKGVLIKQKQLEGIGKKAKTKELPTLRDRYGIKASLISFESTLTDGFMKVQKDQNSQSKLQKIKRGNSVFTSSKRMDLCRPLNFYPAPNAYNITKDIVVSRKGSDSMRSTSDHINKRTKS